MEPVPVTVMMRLREALPDAPAAASLRRAIDLLLGDLALPGVAVIAVQSSSQLRDDEVELSIGGRWHLTRIRTAGGRAQTHADAAAALVHAHCDALVTPAIADALWQRWGGTREPAPPAFAALLRRLARFRLRADRVAAAVPRWDAADHAGAFEDALSDVSRGIGVQLHPATLTQVSAGLSGDDLFPMMIDGLFYELGIRTGRCTAEPAGDLDPDSVRFRINDVRTPAEPIPGADEVLVNDTVDRLRLLNVRGREAINPANGSECAFIAAEFKKICDDAGLTTWTPAGYVVLAASAAIRRHAAALMSEDVLASGLDALETAFPVLIGQLNSQLGLRKFAATLRLLVAEEISIRNFRFILDAALTAPPRTDLALDQYILFTSTWPSFVPALFVDDGETDMEALRLAEHIRMCLKREISHKYTRGGRTLIVYLLDPKIEDRFRDPQALADDAWRDVLAAVRAEVGSLPPTAQNPVILTTASIRYRVRQTIRAEFPHLAVLSYHELSPDMNIQPIARISLG
jgi:type III secretory pathway component EscV